MTLVLFRNENDKETYFLQSRQRRWIVKLLRDVDECRLVYMDETRSGIRLMTTAQYNEFNYTETSVTTHQNEKKNNIGHEKQAKKSQVHTR